MDIKVLRGDITTLKVDAIVNAANNSLLGGAGVDGAIHRAAGKELLNECRTLNGCKTGEAKITKGYNLPAKYVIHTVGPIYDNDPNDAILLANCYKNSLRIAMENDLHSIAFPSISTGVFGYPIRDASIVAINAVKEFLMDNSDYEIDIIFCVFNDVAEKIYKELL